MMTDELDIDTEKYRERVLIPWPFILVMVAALLVLAYDARKLTDRFDLLWQFSYTAAAFGLVLWRESLRRGYLVLFGAAMYAAVLAKIVAFLPEIVDTGARVSGVAVNVILLVLTWRFVRVQSSCSI